MKKQFGDDALSNIKLIIDDVPRNFGKCELDGDFSVDVVPVEKLKDYNPDEYAILITSEYYWKKFENLEKLDFPITDEIYYFEDRDTAYYHEYLEKYKDTPLEDIIVFRSGMRVAKDYPYSDFADNAKALFDHMLENGYNEKYELVWLVGDPNAYEDYKDVKNVTFLDDEWCHADKEEDREKYYRAICLAKYFFFTEHCSFARLPREGQTRIQLWHGHGFKGRNLIEDSSFQYEYMPVGGKLYSDIHERLFLLNHDQLMITGLPKQDWLFHPISEELWDSFEIPKAKKYIFWLPTIRKTGKGSITDNDTLHNETNLPLVKTFDDLSDLNEELIKNDMAIILKIHPEQEDNIEFKGRYKNIFVLDNEKLANNRLNINQILAYSDGLISDYSSVAMDYTMLDKPIAFAFDDKDAYKNSIGFVYDPIEEFIPGEPIYTKDELFGFIEEVSKGKDNVREKRREITRKMNEFQDDKNSERVLKAVGIEK